MVAREDWWRTSNATVINDNDNDFWHSIFLYVRTWWMGSNQVHDLGINKYEKVKCGQVESVGILIWFEKETDMYKLNVNNCSRAVVNQRLDSISVYCRVRIKYTIPMLKYQFSIYHSSILVSRELLLSLIFLT